MNYCILSIGVYVIQHCTSSANYNTTQHCTDNTNSFYKKHRLFLAQFSHLHIILYNRRNDTLRNCHHITFSKIFMYSTYFNTVALPIMKLNKEDQLCWYVSATCSVFSKLQCGFLVVQFIYFYFCLREMHSLLMLGTNWLSVWTPFKEPHLNFDKYFTAVCVGCYCFGCVTITLRNR